MGDARAEVEQEETTNRLLLELMQNADDTVAERPIGYKGLGFKAVLDIAGICVHLLWSLARQI